MVGDVTQHVRTAATIAEDGVNSLKLAQLGCLVAIDAATDDGFTVNEDLSVTYPADATTEMQIAAAEHAIGIRDAAEKIALFDSEIAAKLTSAATRIEIWFPPSRIEPTKTEIHAAGVAAGFWPPALSPVLGEPKPAPAPNSTVGETPGDSPKSEPGDSQLDAETPTESPGPQNDPRNSEHDAETPTESPAASAGVSGPDSGPILSPPQSGVSSVPLSGSGFPSSGTGSGLGRVPAVPPVSAPPSMVSPAALGKPLGVDSVAPKQISPLMPPASTPIAPPLPVTAANPGPPAPVVPAAPAEPVVSVPAASAPVSQPSTAPAVPPPMMMPPPAASPLPVAPVTPTPAVSSAAPPVVSASAAGVGSAFASVVPVTPAEKARQKLIRATRHMISDLQGEARRLAAALSASSRNLPGLHWVVGGCRDDTDGPLLLVSSSVGLGFIPADTQLPDYTAMHVFAHSPNVAWEIKREWLGDPLKAVLGFGHVIDRPVSVVAGRAEVLANVAAVDAGLAVEVITDENLPGEGGVRAGLDRLHVVDRGTADQHSSMSIAALAASLPAVSGPEREPDSARTFQLWGEAVASADIDDSHQLRAWQAFCADQASASAYRAAQATATATGDETKAREYFADHAYFAWNLDQLAQAETAQLP